MGYVIGIDIGGTHTDIVVSDGRGIKVSKTPSTPQKPLEALFKGLEMIAESYGIHLEELIGNCDRFVYSSTIATNIFVQHKLPKIGLLATKGHRDSLWFRDGYKPDRWNLRMGPLWSLVPRYLRLDIRERLNYRGEVLVPLDENDVHDAARKFRGYQVQAVAICFLWSFLNPSHEQRAREIVEAELPGIPIMVSYEVLPVIREWERTFCTALSAGIAKEAGLHLHELREKLMQMGLRHEPLIMQSNGGHSTIDILLKRPLYLVGSGPAGGSVAGIFYGERWKAKDVLTADMGGTSFDVCLLANREIPITKERRLENEPIAIPCVDIHTIGAGGGSIIWLDSGGALQVGPHSAGAEPGPACYGRGGEEPTITDACLLLGYINPDFFLGGKKKLYPELARKAIREKIAEPQGLDIVRAAWSSLEIIISRMAEAMRIVSVQRGIDPAPFILVVGGGAGPIFAGRLAEELGIRHIVVPRQSGAFCALGQICGNLKHEALKPYAVDAIKADVNKLTELYNDMEKQCKEDLLREGIPQEKIKMRRFIDARYIGQVYEVEACIPTVERYKTEQLDDIVKKFEEEHQRLYHYTMAGSPVQFISCRVEAIGEVPSIEFDEMKFAGTDPSAALKGSRRVYSPEDGDFVEAGIYDGERLKPGNVIQKLAIVESEGSALAVLEHQRLIVDKYGDFKLEVPQRR